MQNQMQRLALWIGETFSLPDDSETIRIKKAASVMAQIIGIFAPLVWLIVFIKLSLYMAIVIACVLMFFMTVNLLVFAFTKNLTVHTNVAMALLMSMAVGQQIVNGGLFKSGLVFLWPILCPMLASIILSRRNTIIWLILFLATAFGSVIFDTDISRFGPPISTQYSILFGILNLGSIATVIVGMNMYLVARLDEERERADNLLLNILPGPIAYKLKRSQGVIADGHPDVTVLFADIAGFTQMSAKADPIDVVTTLDVIFSEFDLLAKKHRLEKIKTIGDEYMAAAGLPTPRSDHADAVADMALDMLEVLKNHKGWEGSPISVRIGINTGPVVAGVIGRHKFIYDLWGDAVNTASRMESSGLINMIQVTGSTYEKLRHRYEFEQREPINVKGKGEMVTYLLKGKIISS